ncbi:MAG: HAMP domain-containing protein [Deltaproteobacteria bacterium]|nr:HAMP domain-containing protein [Deltaproteobacteria bacterium]
MIKSLEQRLALFLLLPVAILLFLTGFLGFLYARNIMLREWREVAVLKLQRAAHHLDMRLGRPIQWVNMFHRTAGVRGAVIAQEWILGQLRNMEGVTNVTLTWVDKQSDTSLPAGPGAMMGSMMGPGKDPMMRFHRGRISQVTPPHLDTRTGRETVELVSELKDQAGEVIGRLVVSVGFDYLMQDIRALGWWQSDQACLVDESGRYLAHTKEMEGRTLLGQTQDPLETMLLGDMKSKSFGTRLGPGYPPEQVGGFYKITQAPWAIIMLAPGENILAPIIRFRLYYFLAGTFAILLILLLIRFIGGRLVRSIRELAAAAGEVAKGNYGQPLAVRTSDEIGHLTRSFNAMVDGLKERDLISNTFGRYVDQEIARDLLQRPEAARLGGNKRQVAILMSDIRGFTPLADSLKPEGTIAILNHYFTHMMEPIQAHRGIIVDFFGDALLVFFDPIDGPVQPVLRSAVRCALEMQAAMDPFNAEMKTSGLPEFQMGIGIHAGDVVVGNIGSEYRAKYGIVGTAVNMTERIQSTAKGGEVVISDSALARLPAHIGIRSSFTAELKGIRGEVKLHVLEAPQGTPART